MIRNTLPSHGVNGDPILSISPLLMSVEPLIPIIWNSRGMNSYPVVLIYTPYVCEFIEWMLNGLLRTVKSVVELICAHDITDDDIL